MKKLVFASDHAGFKLKLILKQSASSLGYSTVDLGTDSEESVDYPKYAEKLSDYMLHNNDCFGILICGSGIGISIKANRYSHIRAALCHNKEYAHLARSHNNANVLVLGSRYLRETEATEILKEFLSTPFAGGRHSKRVEQLS